MLKITTTQEENKSVTLHLTGQLTGEYVAELEKAFNADQDKKIVLDLANVTFVDREMMVFLCGMKSRLSITVENIPSYVVRWIEQEFRCGSSYQKPPKD